MTKRIVEYPLWTKEEIEILNSGSVDRYQQGHSKERHQPNPAAWGVRPYERYLAIDVDVGLFAHPVRVTVEREICKVETFLAGTAGEFLSFTTARSTTVHTLDGEALQSIWPEIEMRKAQGVRLTVRPPPQIMENPWAAVTIYRI